MNVLDFSRIAKEDPELVAAMENELKRQRDNIELIASENFVSPAGGSHTVRFGVGAKHTLTFLLIRNRPTRWRSGKSAP